MNVRTLLDNFDLIADAPGGVPKLRELILQMAVRGKLVPQDPKDVSAQVTGSDDTTETEPKYAIPVQWIWTQLGCVIDYNYGGKTESERIPADAWLLDLEDIEKDTSRLLQRVLAGDRKSTSTKSQFGAGDVLYGKLRPYLNKVLVANSDGYCTTEIVPMKPFKGVNPHYVVCVLKSRDFLDYTAARSYGMKMPRLGTEDAKRAPFPLPPLPEQKRIVAKVDDLMKRCDELETRQKERAARHKTLVASCLNALSVHKKADSSFSLRSSTFDLLFTSPESIDELRKTILQLAVQGRLVPQDPKDESAAITLTAAGVEKRYQVTSSEDALGPIPKSWVWVQFLGVGEQRLGKMLDKAKNQGEMRPYLRNTNVQWMRFELGDVKEMRLTAVEQTEFRLKVGDILVCEGGEPGRCAIWNDEIREMYFQKAIHRIRPCSAILSEYIALNLRADSHNGRLATYFTGATIKHFTGRSLGQYTIPVPPLAEQKRIVAKVNALMALCDKQEFKLSQFREVAEKLVEAVVTQSAKRVIPPHHSPYLRS